MATRIGVCTEYTRARVEHSYILFGKGHSSGVMSFWALYKNFIEMLLCLIGVCRDYYDFVCCSRIISFEQRRLCLSYMAGYGF